MKNIRNHIVKTIFFGILCCFVQQARGQFIITENFRGAASPDIIIGDQAYLTSGIDDPVNAGWLRLTTDAGSQKGYAYINRSFPSTLGLLIEFEYKTWRTPTGVGADGFTVFLFDAAYGPGNFALGAYGGSLGYANSTQVTPNNPGLSGGYVGIGFDEYGNFVRGSEGKNGGSTNLSPNSIVLRGPTTGIASTTNAYLDGVTVFTNNSTANALLMSGNNTQNVIDYNTSTSTRPDDATFYRRVQIEIVPNISGTYDIVVRWTQTPNGPFVPLMSHTLTTVPPALLKMGFAASTGGQVNFHEIRNLLVTTPGNLRLVKRADKDILRSIDAGSNANDITYTIDVTNDTDGPLSNINFEDELTDANGTLITPAMFTISSISHTGFLSGTSLPTTSSANQFSGTLNLATNSTGTITVTGTLNAVPAGNVLINTGNVMPTDILDQDLGNNTSTVNTPVISENADLIISKTVGEACLNTVDGNDFTLSVSNMGALPIGYSAATPIVVTETVPVGTTIGNINNAGWAHTPPSGSGSAHTFTLNGTGNLGTGISLSPISFTLTPTTSTGYTNTANVFSSAEIPANQGNNNASIRVSSEPSVPTVTNPVYYCQGETAIPLTATADPGNDLIWYLTPGGAPSNIAYTPNTTAAGTTTYYVSQTNSSCEGPLAQIDVVVLGEITAGSIAGDQTVCKGISPSLIPSITAGTGDGTISYQWESSIDGGVIWTILAAETQATLQPGGLALTTLFRRRTVSTSTKICISDPTNLVTISVKRCKIMTNPMLPSKAKNN